LRLGEHRFQRVGRADVGLLRARADRDAEPDAGDVGGRPFHEPGLGGGIGEHLARGNGKVEWLAAGGELDQLGRGAELEDDLVARGALELRASSRSGPAMPPPGSALRSAACVVAIGDMSRARVETAVEREATDMVPRNDCGAHRQIEQEIELITPCPRERVPRWIGSGWKDCV
jgi:hypothetical protein